MVRLWKKVIYKLMQRFFSWKIKRTVDVAFVFSIVDTEIAKKFDPLGEFMTLRTKAAKNKPPGRLNFWKSKLYTSAYVWLL